MKVVIAKDPQKIASKYTFQDEFPLKTECVYCKTGKAILVCIAHEMNERPITEGGQYILGLYSEEGIYHKNWKMWLHDACCIATYLCPDCLNATSLINQA